ncbi:hypothetical protein SOM11_04920 [Frigoribacterium sp. CFBP9039]|uniref:hypothetical protein n=1 Tax=Frigoribacterium sp. CFBP9029 TaxID=3096541 RepID=UPI002A6A821C|nr:hypothetical protein [Frigoribacterium sp. CFBP9039]MDY0945323.1 hypothetical protein [Frigoribacterium sp. CFBP9039]
MSPTAAFRLRVVLLTLGSLGAILTAGGPVLLAADVLAESRGFRPDGIGLIVPGVVATALVIALSAVACVVVFASGGSSPTTRARCSAALAVTPVLLTGGIAVWCARYLSSSTTFGAETVWIGVAAASVIAFALACAALLGASLVRGDASRSVLLVIGLGCLIAGAVLQPAFLPGAILASALAVCSGAFGADARADRVRRVPVIGGGSALTRRR